MLNLIKEEKIRRMRSESMRRFEERINSKMKDIDKREAEYMRHMFLMILLFLLTENINEIIKSIKARCRKYPCFNSILYLLWQSGDVEANPGPPANSITYRNWLYDVCSVVRKATVGVSPYCKMKNIWLQQPDNWPPGELYFDPRNSNSSIHKVEAFLQILLHCFDHTRQLPHDIKSEIDAWKSLKSKDNSQLLNLYTRRVCYRSTAQSVTILQSHMSVDEVWEFKPDTNIIVKVSRKPATDQNVIAPKLFRADTTRKIGSYLCRIFHGKDPEQKCDHIWKETPVGWPSDCRFYNPYNGGKRCAENEDTRLVRELITLCENNSIAIPKPYKDMIKAWLADDQALLSKLIARQTAEIGIKNALRKLQEGGLLRDSQVAKQLKELGLFVQSTTSIKITKSQKRKTANTITTSKVKRTRIQYDEEDGLDATLKELLPECSIVELLDKSDSHLLDMISPKLSNGFLDDETDDIQCQ
ncbi:Hypothetical predicted protein [Mytilus galloprovincialis]|uniref:Uncharacterized protein n=3 Tax=Mytilus galloprovincialis TaxID=29158 RepID=A0A8B6FE36_MYTGA|nr:Hypothetical predicted protein [Mytilus galloprovincialis]